VNRRPRLRGVDRTLRAEQGFFVAKNGRQRVVNSLNVVIERWRNGETLSSLTPPLFLQLGDLALKRSKRNLNTMPVCVALLLHKSLALGREGLPPSWERLPNVKCSHPVGADKRCFKQRRVHQRPLHARRVADTRHSRAPASLMPPSLSRLQPTGTLGGLLSNGCRRHPLSGWPRGQSELCVPTSATRFLTNGSSSITSLACRLSSFRRCQPGAVCERRLPGAL
jgi:hypothetical protein